MYQICSETYSQTFEDSWLKSQERERDSQQREQMFQQWVRDSQQKVRESLQRQRWIHKRDLRELEIQYNYRAHETQHQLQGPDGALQETEEPVQRERRILDLLRRSWKAHDRERQLQRRERQIQQTDQRIQRSEQQFQYDEREFRVQLSEMSGPHISRNCQPGQKALQRKPLRRSLRLLQLHSAESRLKTQSHGTT
ncbi:hypothetical protein E4U45_004928 [Claviceps purpurea]|nr:hypothetical protein E4U45_004928 [Claviceps purpurea]